MSTTSDEQPKGIRTFSPLEYHEWVGDFIGRAISIHSSRPPCGLAGLFLRAEQYARLSGSQQPFALYPCPGVDPTDISNHAQRYARDRYDDEQEKLALLKAETVRSIPSRYLQDHPDYDHVGPLRGNAIAFADILRHLEERYGQRTAADIAQARHILQTATFDGHDIAAIVATHHTQHAVAASCGQPFSEVDKVDFLAQALLRQDAAFDRPILDYRMSTSEASRIKFSDFAEMMRKYAAALFSQRRQAPAPIGGPTAYAATAAKPDDTVTFLRSELPKLLAEAMLAAKATSDHRSNPPAPRPGHSTQYCWTHGACSHRSADCANPKAGHKKEATVNRRMGGSNRHC